MAILKVGDRDVVSYDDYGTGPVVVLIHGSPGTSKAWQRVGERLSARFRVIAPNLPGCGETTRPPSEGDADISYASALIEALIEEVGAPVVLAGHSHGGVVALSLALRGRVKPRALALFEPVAVPVLQAIGDAEAYTTAKAIFDDYIRDFEAGDSQAVRKMIDYWFGSGAFERLPGGMKEYLIDHTGHNVRDVRATFRERYTVQSIRQLAMPALVVFGSRSPEVMFKIAGALSSLVQEGSLVKLENANHALTTTHVEDVAALIAGLADRCGQHRAEGRGEAGRP